MEYTRAIKIRIVVAAIAGVCIISFHHASAFEPSWADAQTNLIRKAEAGNAQAQASLASLYWYNAHPVGQRGPQDALEFKKCAYWAEKAAVQGQISAQLLLGDLYVEGLGVGKDFTKASHWYFSAARGGHTEAYLRLAKLHRQRGAVGTNMVESYAWFLLAAKNEKHKDHKAECAKSLRQLETILSTNQLAMAKQRAKELMSEISPQKNGRRGKPWVEF